MRLIYFIIIGIFLNFCDASEDSNEADGDVSRKILGSSVVTSVSVVMDTGNGKKTIYTDAVGKPQEKPSNPSELASPIDLLNPDRYEFYTFDDNGDLVKRLMSLDEIKSIIATGDSDAFDLDSFTSQGYLPEKKVNDVVYNVQSVLKEEMEILKDPVTKPIFDTPDVSDSWSMILPAIFGNSGEDIKPEKPISHVTPDTIMLESNMHDTHTTSAPEKIDAIISGSTTIKNRPSLSSTFRPSSITPLGTTYMSQPVYYSSQTLLTTKKIASTTEPSLNVEIFTNSMSLPDTNPTIQSVKDESMLSGKEESLPTRAPELGTSRAPLVRNLTTIHIPSSDNPTTSSSNTFMSSSNFITTQSLNNEMYTSTVTSENSSPISIINSNTTSKTSSQQSNNMNYESTENINTLTDHSVNNSPSLPETSSYEPTITTSLSKATQSSIATSITKLTVEPQLNSSIIVTNLQSTTPHMNKITPVNSMSYPTTTTNTRLSSNNIQDVTKIFLSTLSSQKPTTEMNYPDWTPDDVELFNIFKETIAKGTTTETVESDTTLNNDQKTETTPTSTENESLITNDLSTLSTEYIDQKLITTYQEQNNADPTTKLPSLLNSLSDNQKISASELLDQLLLTTNIYEINTELASSKEPLPETMERFDITEEEQKPSTIQNYDSQTTTEHNFNSYPTTTDITLVHSIEQMLSQAVTVIDSAINQTISTSKEEGKIENSTEGNSTDFLKEAFTEIVGTTNKYNEYTTTEELVSTTESDQLGSLFTDATTNDNLSSSVNALLSQIYENTALSGITVTEIPNTFITYRKVDTTNNPTTPIEANTQASSYTSTENDNKNNTNFLTTTEDSTRKQEETTYYYVIKKKPDVTNVEEESSPIINITILSSEHTHKNRSKPAKADLRLEQELIEEEMKNISLLLKNSSSYTSNINNNDYDSTSSMESIVHHTEDPVGTKESTPTHTTTEKETIQTTEKNETYYRAEIPTTNMPTTIVMKKIKPPPKPAILITINENNTVVTENGKLVANHTVPTSAGSAMKIQNNAHSVEPVKFIEKNSNHNQTWTLVSTVAPQHSNSHNKPPPIIPYQEVINPPVHVDLVPKPMQGFGLEESTSGIDSDVYQFTQLCNELAFGFWKTVTSGLSSARSVFVSPFAAISMLAMVFLGAKGATSEEMNEILKLDDMVTFNPHLIFKNVSESVTNDPRSGIAVTTMIRELFSDRSKGKLLDFYKNRVKAFYDGYVEEVGYREIGDVIRRRTNLLIKKYTNGKYSEFLKDSSITTRPPLSGISVNIFETDCSQTSIDGRDGELHFVVLPSIRQRRLVPIPAVVYKSGFLAGYEPSLDATAVSIGNKDQIVSTILVIPGQQGIAVLGDALVRLEKRLVESSFKKGAWSRLLRSLIPRPGLEVQVPRFTHRSIINSTNTLQRMGLHELFNPESADLRGLNGIANELHLSDVLQINSFTTCGEKKEDGTHHLEIYPATTLRARSARYLQDIPFEYLDEPRDYQRAFHDPLHDPSLLTLPLSLRPRQARIPEVPRLRFDRPFLYFVRHNPSGLILHMGRFNPRLLP